MEVRLFVVNENANARELRLGPETLIGRARECHLRISSNQVSRKHCLITVDGPEVRIRDLGSANGTVLDGVEIPAEVDVPAAPGSELVIGPMRFELRFKAPSHHKRHKNSQSTTTHDILPPMLGAPVGDDDGDTKDYLPAQHRKHASETDEPDSAQLDFVEDNTTSPAAIVKKGEPATPLVELYPDSAFESEEEEWEVIELEPIEPEPAPPPAGPLPKAPADAPASAAEEPSQPANVRPPKAQPAKAKPANPPQPAGPAKPAAKPAPPPSSGVDDEDAELFEFFRRTNP